MTARERWKALHRARRVMLREHKKAFNDLMTLGTGAVLIPNDGGDPRHVPAHDIPREVLLRAADRVVNPPIVVDYELNSMAGRLV